MLLDGSLNGLGGARAAHRRRAWPRADRQPALCTRYFVLIGIIAALAWSWRHG